jgi:alpha,alpha-trehalase
MFEKFSNLDVDSAGRGGEYTVQAGFGWTNDVALRIAGTYGSVLTAPNCPDVLASAAAEGSGASSASASATGGAGGSASPSATSPAGSASQTAKPNAAGRMEMKGWMVGMGALFAAAVGML